MFVTVIHRIHDPEGLRAEAEGWRRGFLQVWRCQSTRLPPITDSASVYGKANQWRPWCARSMNVTPYDARSVHR